MLTGAGLYIHSVITSYSIHYTKLYDSAGEDPIPGADGRSLCRSIRQRGTIDPIFVATPAEVPAVLADVLKNGDVVLTQGAGNVGQLSKKLAELKLDIGKMKVQE